MNFTWFCGECGNEFDGPNVEELPCPTCGRILHGDVELTNCMFQDAGYVIEQKNMHGGIREASPHFDDLKRKEWTK